MPDDTVPASRKLGREEARALAAQAKTVIVAKGKKASVHPIDGAPDDAVIDAMLGPTGNLRAPVLRAGDTVVVGFSEEHYRAVLLG